MRLGEHLIVDPRVCHGKLTYKGTRLPVETVLTLLVKKGRSIDYIRKSWPHLKREAIEEAIRLAAVAWPGTPAARGRENNPDFGSLFEAGRKAQFRL
jgi:uncharacterized protein (DUF433 family)